MPRVLCKRFKDQFVLYYLDEGLLKGGGRGEAGTFSIKFFFLQGLSFLHLEITLPFAKLCYAFEEKSFFSATIIL